MKAILALLLLLIVGGVYHYYNTNYHPVYSRETYVFRERLNEIIEEVNNSKTTWVAGKNEMFDNMVKLQKHKF